MTGIKEGRSNSENVDPVPSRMLRVRVPGGQLRSKLRERDYSRYLIRSFLGKEQAVRSVFCEVESETAEGDKPMSKQLKSGEGKKYDLQRIK